MEARSVHDNQIIAYEVDAESRRITLHTRFNHGELVEHTDILFDGVLAYNFEGDNFGNIIFSVAEVPLAHMMHENRTLFEEGKKYAWPGVWNESPEACLRHFESNEGKAFSISSSYGMGGWVIAKSCRFDAVVGRRTPSNAPLKPTGGPDT